MLLWLAEYLDGKRRGVIQRMDHEREVGMGVMEWVVGEVGVGRGGRGGRSGGYV